VVLVWPSSKSIFWK